MVARLLGQDPTDADRVIVYDQGSKTQISVPADQVSNPDAAGNVFVNSVNGDIRLFNSSIPNATTFDSLTVPYQQATDIITHEFYDSAALTSAAANTGRLFLNPQQNPYNGNLNGNGVLSNNERFFMIGIRHELENNDTTNPLDIVDVVQTYRLGTYSFFLGSSKFYNQSKLMRFIDPETYFTVNTKYYAVKPFITWKLPVPIAIGKQMQFYDEYTLTAATLDATTRLFAYLVGFWYRNVQ